MTPCGHPLETEAFVGAQYIAPEIPIIKLKSIIAPVI